METSAEFQELRSDVSNLTHRFDHGQIDVLDTWPKILIQVWRKRDWVGYLDSSDLEGCGPRTVEDKTFDRLGRLAALAEFDQAVGDDFYGTWMESKRYITARRFVLDSAVLLGLLAGIANILVFATGDDKAWSLAFATGFLFLRFSTPFENLVKPTYLRYYAQQALKGKSVEQNKLMRDMRNGLSNEAIVMAVAVALSEARLKVESDRLAGEISEELCGRESELDTAVEAITPAPAFAALLGRDHTQDPSWDQLQAQRALLSDLRARAEVLESR